ncbi:MAG: hypothetical protein WCS42_04685 [Verrucomicrobiota bacterium]
MLTIKEIAARDDVDCHPKTVKKWLGYFGILPDQRGHGPNKFKHTTATRFVKLFNDFFKSRGTTPQIVKAKYAGKFSDARQMNLDFSERNTVRKPFRKSAK